MEKLHNELHKDIDSLLFHIERVAFNVESNSEGNTKNSKLKAMLLLSYAYNNKKSLTEDEIKNTVLSMIAKINNRVQ